MKKRNLLILILLTLSVGVNAQTLQEKLAKKLAAKIEANRKKNGKGPVGTEALDPNVSQSKMAAKWESKEYKKFARHGAEDGTRKLKIEKEGENVKAIWLGDIKYLADEHGKSEFVRYYKTTGSGHYKVVFMSNKILVFTTTLSGQYTTKYFLGKKGSHNDLLAVKSYIEKSEVNQKADLDAYAKNEKENADKAFAEKEAKWSIKGKKVSKIQITDIKAPYSFGYYRPFSFQVKATLSNGKTISTKDGGFWSDYTITYLNGDVKSKTIQDTKFIKGDKIIIQVKSKFDGNVKATGNVVMNYSETLTMNFSSNNWGKSGSSLKIEIKQRKHAVTGKAVVMIKVTDLTGYSKPKYMIVDANESLNVNTNGSNGYKTVNGGHDNGHGANAGNGGNITVYKDPSAKDFNINYEMRGGTGGAGVGYGYNRGRDGRDGVYKEIVRTVNF